MVAKMGRPQSDNPKAQRLTVRMDKDTVEILNKYCASHNMERAEAVREGIRKLADPQK